MDTQKGLVLVTPENGGVMPGGVGTMGHTPTPSRFGATFTAGGGAEGGGGGAGFGGGRGPTRGGGGRGLQIPTYMV